MIRKLFTAIGICATALLLMGQYGYQITATQITAAMPLTADTTIVGDSIYLYFGDGTAGDARMKWNHSTNEFQLQFGGADSVSFQDAGGDTTYRWEDMVAAGGSVNLYAITSTASIMNGSDTIAAIYIGLTNADHTGSGNLLYGINIGGITGDAQATEAAIYVGDGWDYGLHLETSPVSAQIYMGGGSTQWIQFDGVAVISEAAYTGFRIAQFDGAIANASTGGTALSIGAGGTIGIMNGSDTKIGLDINLVNADHSGSSNYLKAINIATIAPDAQAEEVPLVIGHGWEAMIANYDSQELGTLTWTVTGDITGGTKAGGIKVFINGQTYYIQLYEPGA